jgi:hypothetical protein
MAQKRMFTMNIVDSDAFLDMPLSSQCLYFHLNMRADDDGFIGNPKRIQKIVGASEDDLKLLIAKRFILVFEDGVIVIKHWRMHNTIRSDRYNATQYQDELALLSIKDNKSYSLSSGNQLATIGNQNASTGLGLDIGLDIDIELDIDKEVKKEKKQRIKEAVTYVPDVLLNQTINDFIASRKKKSPMTDKAIELMIKKLDEMTSDNDEKIQIINQSIMNGWKGIFPIKNGYNKKPTTEEYAKKLEEWANG